MKRRPLVDFLNNVQAVNVSAGGDVSEALVLFRLSLCYISSSHGLMYSYATDKEFCYMASGCTTVS